MSKAQPIIKFSADRTVIRPGEHATLRWRVEGVKAVYLFRKGEPWQEHGVVGQGEQRVSPGKTSVYRLRVVKADDSVEVKKIEIQVGQDRPAQAFSVDRPVIDPGECVTFRWRVEGVKAVYFYAEGQRWREHGVVGVGEQRVCPPQTTTYFLRVIKTDDSVEMHKMGIQVRAQGTSQALTVDRTQIRRGECVTFRWRVEGVKAVYFHPKNRKWQDHGVVGVGEKQVCPKKTRTFCLRVVRVDDSVEVHKIKIEVNG